MTLGLWVEIVWWLVGPVFVLAAAFVGLPDAFAVIFSQGVLFAIVGLVLWLIWRGRARPQRTRWSRVGVVSVVVAGLAFLGAAFPALTVTSAPDGLLRASLAISMIALAASTSALALHVHVNRREPSRSPS